jgi:hypothetical protein
MTLQNGVKQSLHVIKAAMTRSRFKKRFFMTLVVLHPRHALAVNELLNELDDDTFPGDVDSAMIAMTAQLGGVDEVSSMSMDVRLLWLQHEKAVLAEGKGEPVSRNMIEFLFDRGCKNFSSNLKTGLDLAGFIARNPDILDFSLAGQEPKSTVMELARSSWVASYLKSTHQKGVDEAFVRQFPVGFNPLENYRQAALDLVTWLEDNAVALADGYTFDGLRAGVSHINDAENELLYFFHSMALENAETNPAYPIFAKRILLAEQALALKDMFNKRMTESASA